MARRKNAAALFEVIHSDNRFTPRHQPSSWSLRPPRWFRWRPFKSSAEAPTPGETIDYAAPEPAAPRGPSLLSRIWSAMPSMPRIGMSLDPERQLVRFQLSYTGALVSAFTVIVAVALAYMAGRGTSHRPMPALTDQTTEQLRNGPVLADVLDVSGGGNDSNDPPAAMAVSSVPASTGGATTAQPPQVPTVVTGRQAASRTSVATAQQPGGSAQAPAKPQAVRPNQFSEPAAPNVLMVSDANRQHGLQYVIVQSYPEEEKALAESAMATLNQAGVLCTVQRGLPYAPSWYCVVGITGFSRTRDVPEYDAYINRIMQISNQFAGTSKFKKFEPKPFRWREIAKTPADKPDATPALKGPTPKQ